MCQGLRLLSSRSPGCFISRARKYLAPRMQLRRMNVCWWRATVVIYKRGRASCSLEATPFSSPQISLKTAAIFHSVSYTCVILFIYLFIACCLPKIWPEKGSWWTLLQRYHLAFSDNNKNVQLNSLPKFPATSPDDPSLGDPPFVEQKDRERHFPRERTASVMLFIRLGCKAWKVIHV